MANTANTTPIATEETNLLYVSIAAVVGFAIFTINSFTLTLMFYYKQMKDNHNLHLANLMLSDAMSGVALGITFLELAGNECLFGTALYTAFIFVWSIASSWQTLVMSVDRLISVQFALTYYTIMTPVKIKLLISAVWILSLIEAAVLSFGQHCSGYREFIYLTYAVNMLIVFCANTCIYAQLWRVARRQTRQIIAQLQQQQQQTAVVDKATIMVIVIVLMNGVCWAPYVIAQIIYTFANISSQVITVVLLGYMNSFLNCIVYVYMNKTLKSKIGKALKCITR